MKKLLILFLAISAACQPAEQKDDDSLKDEVMAIHDEVMPKMGDLRRTRKDLVKLADSIIVTDSTKAAALMALADQIGEASEGMMQWMRAYEPAFEGTDEEIQAYLEEQKKSIQQVKEDMEGALANGEEALGIE